MGVVVSPVEKHADRRAFLDVQDQIYAKVPQWIAPLSPVMRRTFDPRRNPFHGEATTRHFLARDEAGRAVGRIAASIHPSYVDRHGPRAFFGFFESVDDHRVAKALLSAAEAWASARGMKTVLGPCSYTTSQEVGMLVDGFDQSPAFLQPYNPPYYRDLMRACGYEPLFTAATYSATREAHGHIIPRLEVRADRVLKREGLTVRSVDMRVYDQELEILRQLYNRAFASHPEAAPIARQVFGFQAGLLRDIVDPAVVRIIEHEGRPLAFAVLLPNLNEIVAATRGKLTPLLLFRWSKLLANVRSIVVLMIGATPDWHGRGIGRCLVGEIGRAVASGRYSKVFTTWIHEGNQYSTALVRHLDLRPERTYAVFGKSI